MNATYRGVETVASIIVRGGVRVRVFGGSGGLKNTRITERTQWFILIWPIDALRLASNDPYTKKHPKSGRLQQSVREKERDLVGDPSMLILGLSCYRWSLPPRQRGGI